MPALALSYLGIAGLLLACTKLATTARSVSHEAHGHEAQPAVQPAE
jgi:hypothetical protein